MSVRISIRTVLVRLYAYKNDLLSAYRGKKIAPSIGAEKMKTISNTYFNMGKISLQLQKQVKLVPM